MNQTLSSVLCFATSSRVKVLEGTWRGMAASVLGGIEWEGVSQKTQRNKKSGVSLQEDRRQSIILFLAHHQTIQGVCSGSSAGSGGFLRLLPWTASAPKRFGNPGRRMWGTHHHQQCPAGDWSQPQPAQQPQGHLPVSWRSACDVLECVRILVSGFQIPDSFP